MRAHLIAVSLLLSLAVLAPTASAQASVWTRYGTTGLDLFGISIDRGGDFDGDAVPDLVVGMPQYAVGGSYDGRVQILSGATGSVVRTIQGGSFAGLGLVVAALRDVDGDLVPDVLASRLGLGAVRVLSGANGTTIRTHTGAELDGFGATLAGLGDVNADGRGDYAIFANSESPAGVARVYSGATGSILYTFAGTGGPNGTVMRGRAVGVGDLDADGRDDFALLHTVHTGSPGFGVLMGRVSVHSGATGAQILALLGTPPATFGGAALLGDLDGDGVAELLVGQGTVLQGEVGYQPGRASAYSLATGALVRSFFNPQPTNSDNFGESVAALGDVDLDGVPDVAVASSGPNGVWAYSGATGAVLQSYQRSRSCLSGLRVASLPDVDGDGRAELVIAEPCADYGAQPLTRVSRYSGATVTEHGANSCFGDGTSAACPCANPGPSGVGCVNSTGVGSALRAHGSTSVARDDLWFDANGLPGASSGSTYLFVGSGLVSGGLGVAHFGGVRCAGSLMRLGQHRWKGAGVASWPTGLRAIGVWSAGSTRHFQALYRDVTHPCSPANFTNLVTMTFAP